jgi:hypothetical protein
VDAADQPEAEHRRIGPGPFDIDGFRGRGGEPSSLEAGEIPLEAAHVGEAHAIDITV